ILEEMWIEVVVEMVDTLHDVEIGESGGRMNGSVPEDRSTAGVRGSWNLIGVSHVGDFLGFRDTAAPGDVVHHNIDGPRFEHLAEAKARRQPLADTDRNGGFAG